MEKARFTEWLLAANDIDRQIFTGWAFLPGMFFNSPDKWWGDFGQRDFPHEGVDFCLYADQHGRVHRLDENTRVPVMHAGVVRALFDDYLGQAVILEHANVPGAGKKLMAVYAHTQPLAGIEPGAAVKAGDIIATIADTSRSKARILPHLHLSFGYPSARMSYDPFEWNSMRDPGLVALIDPLPLIDRPHRVLDADDQNLPLRVNPTRGAAS